MPEQITLRQIAEMMRQELAAQTAVFDQKLATQITSLDQKLTNQVTSLDQKLTNQIASLDQKLDDQAASFDQKLADQTASLDQKFAEQTAHVEDTMAQAIESAVAILKANQANHAEWIINQVRILAENVEGTKIAFLAEASQSHNATLNDHENRIYKLEEAVG